jgi:hypothetical protein
MLVDEPPALMPMYQPVQLYATGCANAAPEASTADVVKAVEVRRLFVRMKPRPA